MTRREQGARTCNRKQRYDTQVVAMRALVELRLHGRRRTRRQWPTDVYRCPTCFGWHLTSHPKPPKPWGQP